MPFLPPNQQRQSDEEGKSIQNKSWISDSAPDPVLPVVSRFENFAYFAPHALPGHYVHK